MFEEVYLLNLKHSSSSNSKSDRGSNCNNFEKGDFLSPYEFVKDVDNGFNIINDTIANFYNLLYFQNKTESAYPFNEAKEIKITLLCFSYNTI